MKKDKEDTRTFAWGGRRSQTTNFHLRLAVLVGTITLIFFLHIKNIFNLQAVRNSLNYSFITNAPGHALSKAPICIVGNAETFESARKVFEMWGGRFPSCWFIWGEKNETLAPTRPGSLMYVQSGEKSSWSQGIEAAVSALKGLYDCEYVFTHDDDLVFQTVPSHLPSPSMSLPDALVFILRTYRPAMAAFAWDVGDEKYPAMQSIKESYRGQIVAPLTGFDNGNVIYHKSVLPLFIPFSPRGEGGFVGRWTLGAHFLQLFGPMIFGQHAVRIQGISYLNTVNPDNTKGKKKVVVKEGMAFYDKSRHPYEFPTNNAYIKFLEGGLLDPSARWGRQLMPSDVEAPVAGTGLHWYSEDWIMERLMKQYDVTNPALSSNAYLHSALSHRNSSAIPSSGHDGHDMAHRNQIGMRSDTGIKFRIQIFTQNRFQSFLRLWKSINRSRPINKPVVIFIHVDGVTEMSSKSRELRERVLADVNKLKSRHGKVTVISHDEQIGLRHSIMMAWPAADDNEFCIFLEDDLEVSEHFLEFADKMASTYFSAAGSPVEKNLMGISLYNNQYSEVLEARVQVVNDNMPYLYQMPQSWGAVYAAPAWRSFLAYYDSFDSQLDPNIPDSYSNRWSHATSWKKYLLRYMYETGSYLLYPNFADHLSLSTNRMTPGTHHKGASESKLKRMKELFEVSLLNDSSSQSMSFAAPSFQDLQVFNAYHEKVVDVSSLQQMKPVNTFDGCTMVLTVYSRVENFLPRIRYYSQSKSLSRIVVVWNNVDISPPDIPANLMDKVRLLRMEKNSLNNRFFPWPDIETDCVVNMDDDWELDLEKLDFVIRSWKGHGWKFLVGFSHLGRNHVQLNNGTYYYSSTDLQMSAHPPPKPFSSMVLPSGMVYHREYLHMYTFELPEVARRIVDEIMNCDDLLFNFMVANATHKGPVLIFDAEEYPKQKGLWHRGSHFAQRSECLRNFTALFGEMPLRYSLNRFTQDARGKLPSLDLMDSRKEIPYPSYCNPSRLEQEYMCQLNYYGSSELPKDSKISKYMVRYAPLNSTVIRIPRRRKRRTKQKR